MKLRNLFIIAAIAFQVIAVASIALSKEWILKTGNEIILQTAPIDPRDIFRGDYVRLNYLFSQVPASMLDADIIENGIAKGAQVYLALETNSIGISQARSLGLSPPATKPFLAGRIKAAWPYRGYLKNRQKQSASKKSLSKLPNFPVRVKYGIEQYYVEQGSGKEMEKIRGTRNSFQVPLMIHAAVSPSGEAVIRSYEWANLAVKTEILQRPERDAPDELASAVIRFTIKNRSDHPIALPWKSQSCSFALIPAQSIPDDVGALGFGRPACLNAIAGGKTLAPDDEVSVDFDLNNPDWYLNHSGEATPLGKLPPNYRFRVTYQDGKIVGLNANILSRSFHGRGNID